MRPVFPSWIRSRKGRPLLAELLGDRDHQAEVLAREGLLGLLVAVLPAVGPVEVVVQLGRRAVDAELELAELAVDRGPLGLVVGGSALLDLLETSQVDMDPLREHAQALDARDQSRHLDAEGEQDRGRLVELLGEGAPEEGPGLGGGLVEVGAEDPLVLADVAADDAQDHLEVLADPILLGPVVGLDQEHAIDGELSADDLVEEAHGLGQGEPVPHDLLAVEGPGILQLAREDPLLPRPRWAGSRSFD